MDTINTLVPQHARSVQEATRLGSLYINGGGQEYWIKATLLDAFHTRVLKGLIYHQGEPKPIGYFLSGDQGEIELLFSSPKYHEEMDKWLKSQSHELMPFGEYSIPYSLQDSSIEGYIASSTDAMIAVFTCLLVADTGFLYTCETGSSNNNLERPLTTFSLGSSLHQPTSGYKTNFEAFIPDLIKELQLIFLERKINEVLVWNALAAGCKHIYKRDEL